MRLPKWSTVAWFGFFCLMCVGCTQLQTGWEWLTTPTETGPAPIEVAADWLPFPWNLIVGGGAALACRSGYSMVKNSQPGKMVDLKSWNK